MNKTETILGQIPSKSNSYRIITIKGHGSLAKTAAAKAYQEYFLLQIREYKNKGIEEFTYVAKVYYDSRRPDLDGHLKMVLDCLQKANAIVNDNKALRIVCDKYLDKENPRIEIMIVPGRNDLIDIFDINW